jgi:hypothetical protein
MSWLGLLREKIYRKYKTGSEMKNLLLGLILKIHFRPSGTVQQII